MNTDSDSEYQRVLHDLQVHQVELQMQNNQLQEAENKLLTSYQELQQINELFSQLYHLSPIGYVMLNNKAIIHNANKKFSQLVKFPLEKINHLHFVNFIDDDSKTLFITRFSAFFKSPEDKQLEICLKSTDDKKIIVNLKATLISANIAGEFHLLVSVDDITALKKAEQAAQNAREIAEKANLAKSEFLSRMSHELRTPLNAILGFGQLFAMDESLDIEQQEDVLHILNAGNYLLDLVNEILDIAKIDAGKADFQIEKLSIQHLINGACLLISPVIREKQITLTQCLAKDYKVMADAMRLKQVLLNLLSNAVKYNRPQGSIKISVSLCAQHYLRICIEDSGFGIKKEDYRLVFEPFSRIAHNKSEIEGTGVGLMITKKLVEAMNGKIGFDSEEQVGTTFWIELPLAQH